MNLEIGSTVGDYQVVGILGAGGMGQVYKVRNVISDRVEAMKVLLPDLVNQPDLADRFLREIKVQGSLEHPNIAALHTAVRVDNQLLMLMEFVEGVTLDQKLKDGPLPAAEAVNYIMQVLSALEYAHARGVVHRDIKPANMMLTPGGVVKLMDFGIARSSADHKLTQTGTTVGSLYYMSPEQIQGVTAPDGRSDLYSVGVSLYELVTGKRPFDGDSQFAIMSAHLAGTPVPPVTVDPRLPQVAQRCDSDVGRERRGCAISDRRGVAQRAVQRGCRTEAGRAPGAGRRRARCRRAAARPASRRKRGKPGSHRGLWMGLGAVAAVLAIVAVVAIAPWKGTGAAPAKVAAPAAQPPVSEPPAPVAAQPSSQPEPQPQQPAALVPAPQAAAPVSTPVNASPRVPSRTPGVAKAVPAVSHRSPRRRSAGAAPAPTPQPAPPQPAPHSNLRRNSPRPPPGPAARNCSRSASISRWWACARPASAPACNRCSVRRPPAA